MISEKYATDAPELRPVLRGQQVMLSLCLDKISLFLCFLIYKMEVTQMLYAYNSCEDCVCAHVQVHSTCP
jgi:hypothetical protein